MSLVLKSHLIPWILTLSISQEFLFTVLSITQRDPTRAQLEEFVDLVTVFPRIVSSLNSFRTKG